MAEVLGVELEANRCTALTALIENVFIICALLLNEIFVAVEPLLLKNFFAVGGELVRRLVAGFADRVDGQVAVVYG